MANPLLEQFVSRPPKLEGDVELHIQPIDDRHVWLRLRHEGSGADLRAAALSVPYPSGLNRLLASEPDLDAVLVERIPPGLDEAAKSKGIAVLDRQGKGRVVRPGLVYVVAPSVASPQRQSLGKLVGRSSPFARRASRIPRILLAEPAKEPRLSDIAAIAEMNPGSVHKILSALQEIGLVERDGDHYGVPDRGSLLEAWADANKPPKESFRISVNEGEVSSLVRDVAGPLGDRAVLSGEVAAELLAPHLSPLNAIVHVPDANVYGDLAEAWQESALPFKRGAIRVDLADEQIGLFGSEVAGLNLVSPAQLYIDMYGDRGRGRDAAEQVRAQVLAY